MKTILLSIFSAFMVSTIASAQTYVNVIFDKSAVRSFSVESVEKVSIGERKEIGTINGHAYVELAGKKWATENVANMENKLKTKEDKRPAIAVDAKYGMYYTKDNNKAGIARDSWGDAWKIPSVKDWQDLINKCYWYYTKDYNGMVGCIVYEAQEEEDKGKSNMGISYTPKTEYSVDKVPHIFLPAAGCYIAKKKDDSDIIGEQINFAGEIGLYSTEYIDEDEGHILYFNSKELKVGKDAIVETYNGMPVRLVAN